MDATAAAHGWADMWARAWPLADVDAISALYADDADFHSHPFRDRQTPAEYVSWAFGQPIAAGDRAAVDWWAVITDRDGSEQTVAGTSLLRFRHDGLVVEQRDVWADEPGRRELPACLSK